MGVCVRSVFFDRCVDVLLSFGLLFGRFIIMILMVFVVFVLYDYLSDCTARGTHMIISQLAI